MDERLNSETVPRVISVRNVNQALFRGMQLLKFNGVETESRGIAVIEYPAPVITQYANPRERVLFDPVRDANPFFHFFEALWILAGRRDVEFLKYFNANISNYSDDGVVFHAPYGYRIRNMYGGDQLMRLVRHLQKKPDSRQGVLQIWDHRQDLDAQTKDIPCNDMVFFKIRDNYLDMTVCCRSNDIVWGAYGANAVQFSMLQEYIAALLDIGVGAYCQISDSFHAYPSIPFWTGWKPMDYAWTCPYTTGEVEPYPLFTDPQEIDNDLASVFTAWDAYRDISRAINVKTELISYVAIQMFAAWKAYKSGDLEGAKSEAYMISATDWCKACTDWLQRRIDRRVKNVAA